MPFNTANRFKITGKLSKADAGKTKNGKDCTNCLLAVDDSRYDKAASRYIDCVASLAFQLYGKNAEEAKRLKGKDATITFRLDSYAPAGGEIYGAKPDVIKIEMAAIAAEGTQLSDGVDFTPTHGTTDTGDDNVDGYGNAFPF